jgi:hypothetical protein
MIFRARFDETQIRIRCEKRPKLTFSLIHPGMLVEIRATRFPTSRAPFGAHFMGQPVMVAVAPV